MSAKTIYKDYSASIAQSKEVYIKRDGDKIMVSKTSNKFFQVII
jgi:hypothetical protein